MADNEITKSAQRKGRGLHPNSLANLRPSTKGMTNNPNGRTEGSRNLSTLLREMLAMIAPDEIVNSKFVREFCRNKRSITNADALTARLISEGLLKGEAWAIKEILDRTEGKAMLSVDVTSDGEKLEGNKTFILDFTGNVHNPE